MKIVLIGAKASGKSTIGRELARELGLQYVETDELLVQLYNSKKHGGGHLSCREIFDALGEEGFRNLEQEAVAHIEEHDWKVIITGGSTFVFANNRRILRKNAIVVYCKCAVEELIARLHKDGVVTGGLSKAVFLDWYKKDIERKDEIYSGFADIILDTEAEKPQELARRCREALHEELAIRCTEANTFGEIIRLTTFGESHGEALGAVLDGVGAGIAITREDIQKELDRRRPGQSAVTTPRGEKDAVHILSGIFNGYTTGSPIALVVYNSDSDSSKYEAIRDRFRPGHADFTFFHKYATHDYRGGGRSSGRETVARVAGGAIAKKRLLQRGVSLYAHTVELAGITARTCDYDAIEKNAVRCGDMDVAQKMVDAVEAARSKNDSVGGIVQLEVHGLVPGLGDPVFAKLDARLGHAMMSIGAVKGIEIGDGFEMARLRGSGSNDAMNTQGFATNNAGGVLGGISTGAPLLMRIAVKPTPSISQPQETINKEGEAASVTVEGRHDPCIVPRIIPVIESMAALVVLDAWEIQSRLHPGWDKSYIAAESS